MIDNNWRFCEGQVCPFCRRELEDEDYDVDDFPITKCAFCDRSFVE